MIKRVLLFVATNLLVVATISIVLNVLGVRPYLTHAGIDYTSLLIFCLVWGFGGAGISLALSRIMAKWSMGVKIIQPGTNPEYQWLYNMVAQLAKGANLPAVPEVGIYDSPEINAFATGPTKRRSLVAFSSGIIRSMDRTQLQAVAAHEISHIQNGDMVTMTLLQGVVNAFVLFLARIIGFAIAQSVKEEDRGFIQGLVVFGLDIVLSLLGTIVVMWFSRQREFRADRGAANLVGANGMASALHFLGSAHEMALAGNARSLDTLKISGGPSRFGRLFMSHPPIEERIAALRVG